MSREHFLPQTKMITHGFLFVSNRSNASQLVTLGLDSKPITVLCQMGDFGCGDGGWTPVMKTDGKKVSLIWRNIRILGGVFLRVMKRKQEIFSSVEQRENPLVTRPYSSRGLCWRKFFYNTLISKNVTNFYLTRLQVRYRLMACTLTVLLISRGSFLWWCIVLFKFKDKLNPLNSF